MWQELLPWWSPFAAFGVILFYGFLRENYEEVDKRKKEYRELEKKKDNQLRQARAQREQIEAETKDLEKQLTTAAQRKALKDLLGDAIDAGKRLQAAPHYDAEGGIKKVTEQDIEEWVRHVHDLIEAALDKAEARRFLSNTGITLESLHGIKTDPINQITVGSRETWVDARLKRLEELIGYVGTLDVRPDFNPQDWTE